ncbi:MAG: galactose mutarotase [Rikenellaceae bacterium]|nr:galactose mutarotase [Rikenellaceae bacterium]
MKKTVLLAALFAFAACGGGDKPATGVNLLDSADFQTIVDGKEVSLYTLQNENGMAVQLSNYGARIVALWVPAKDGSFVDVSHGYDNIEGYLTAGDNNSGPVVGRYGNRIANGRFYIDGKEYQLQTNENHNHLHGGDTGFGFRVWNAAETTVDGNPAVAMNYLSPDGEGGYPGNLDITVTYSLTPDNRLVIDYKAETDAPTVLNPTSHTYFNLHGTPAKSILTHQVMIAADGFTATDEYLIPTGEIVPVEGTPLDFRTPVAVGDRIEEDYEALDYGLGYDHNFLLNKSGAGVELAAEVWEPATGVVMTVYTDQPAIQFYSGNFMDGSDVGKGGIPFTYRTGIALEAQNYPDAPNHDTFPSAELRPGEVYTQTTIYAFGVR